MSIRILIADDHNVVRSGLAAILNGETGMHVVGEASTTEDALNLAEELKPDLVLMDISMPTLGGIEATQKISKQHPEIRVLVLTLHEDESLVRAAIHAGAAGYILKRALKTELFSAIHTVMQGDLYIHPALMRSLMSEATQSASRIDQKEEPLSPRELEVLRFIAQGYTNNQIAELIHISVRTVEYHRANLMGKLNITSRVDLVKYAADHGIT